MTTTPPDAAQAATPTSMREQMARDIFAVSARQFNSHLSWEQCQPKYRQLVFEEVDAALKALLKYYDLLVDAGGRGIAHDVDHISAARTMRHYVAAEFQRHYNAKAAAAFTAMIRAALEGK